MSFEKTTIMDKPVATENVVSDTDYAGKILKSMHNQLTNSKYCDVKIKVKDTEFPCHKIVLAGASSQLGKMLDFVEYNGVLEINSIDSETMISLLNFMYTGSINITAFNAKDIFLASEFLKISFLQKTAIEILESSIDITNCLQFYTLAQLYNCVELEKKSFNFAQKNFNRVWHSKGFLELSHQQLVNFLKADKLRRTAVDEQFVFFAAQRWFCEQAKKETCDLFSVMETVRFESLDPYFLHDCCELFPTLKLTPEVMELIEKAKLLKKEQGTVVSINENMLTDSTVEVLLVVVGELYDSLPSFYCYRTETNQWFRLCEFPFPFMARSAVTWENQVYVLGRKLGAAHDEILQFEETLSKWKYVSEITRRRKYFSGIVAHNHCLYAVGKCADEYNKTLNKTANTVEQFDLKSALWSELAPFDDDNGVNSTVLIASNGKLYIAGGGSELHVFDSLYEYDLTTNTWRQLASMLSETEKASGCVIGNFIYIIGVAVKDNKFYVVGGLDMLDDDYAEPIRYLECFNPAIDEWETVSIIPDGLRAFSCTTFKVKESTLTDIVNWNAKETP